MSVTINNGTQSNNVKQLQITEKELEDAIFDASKTNDGRTALRKRGLHFVQHQLYRQVNFGKYGIADLIQIGFSLDEFGGMIANVDIIELKKDEINFSTFDQALKYAKIVTLINEEYNTNGVAIAVHLIGRKVDLQTNFVYLPDLISSDYFSIHLYTYKIDIINGFAFKQHMGYSVSNSNIKESAVDFIKIYTSVQNNLLQEQVELLKECLRFSYYLSDEVDFVAYLVIKIAQNEDCTHSYLCDFDKLISIFFNRVSKMFLPSPSSLEKRIQADELIFSTIIDPDIPF